MNNFYNIKPNKVEYNECIIKGICSVSPTLSAIQGLMFTYLQEMAFYILKLYDLGARNESIKDNFLNFFSIIMTKSEYNFENLKEVILIMDNDIKKLKLLYKDLCLAKNKQFKYLKSSIKLKPDFNITDIIIQGQKCSAEFKKALSEEQKNLFEIILIITKSIYLYIMELKELNEDIEYYYKILLSAVKTASFYSMAAEQIEKKIKEYSNIDHELMKLTYEKRKDAFGDFIETEVSFSQRPGKAILVVGTNVKELEMILEATKDRNIDIYTHGQMIVGHTFSKLKRYPNLIGHYGHGEQYNLFDFAEFPGAIFLTKHSLVKVEQFYRGRIYTTDLVPPSGVVRIRDNDFEPLIQSALHAEGFEEEIYQKTIKAGFIEEAVFTRIHEIAEKMEKNEIKHFFGIGVPNNTEEQKKYMTEFVKLLNKECFSVSFSYANNISNVFYINIDYGFPIIYSALEILSKALGGMEKLNPIMMFTRCEPHTISNLFTMKFMGINKIYFWGCSPNLMNPVLVDLVKEKLGIKGYTNPKSDFEQMIKD